jgi:hypothetical protein
MKIKQITPAKLSVGQGFSLIYANTNKEGSTEDYK